MPKSYLRLDNFNSEYYPEWAVAFPKSWHLIRSKSSQEDRACHNLSQMGIEILCPRIETKPLFPGYLFGNFSLNSLSSVNSAYGVLRVVQFGKTPAEVAESVIEEIRVRMNSLADVRTFEFKRGDRVRVTSGAFDGWEGMFDCRIPGKQRAKIMLNTVFSANTTCYQVTRGAAMSLEIGLGELVSA